MCNIVIINVILGVRYLLEACKVLGFLGFGLFFFLLFQRERKNTPSTTNPSMSSRQGVFESNLLLVIL